MHANGANVLHLNPDRIESYQFLLPPERVRHLYAKEASSIYQQCDVFEKKNSILRRTRDLLLPKLISGEVDVSQLEVVGATTQ